MAFHGAAALLLIPDLAFSTVNTMGQDFVNRSLAEYRTPDKDMVLISRVMKA